MNRRSRSSPSACATSSSPSRRASATPLRSRNARAMASISCAVRGWVGVGEVALTDHVFPCSGRNLQPHGASSGGRTRDGLLDGNPYGRYSSPYEDDPDHPGPRLRRDQARGGPAAQHDLVGRGGGPAHVLAARQGAAASAGTSDPRRRAAARRHLRPRETRRVVRRREAQALILVDANFLFYAIYPEGPEHRACRKLLEQWSGGETPWYTTWSVVYEFLRITTHPRVLEKPWP